MTVKIAKRYILLFLGLLIVGSLIAFRVAPASGVKRQLEKIHAAGLPISGEELNVWYKTVPSKDNRALLLVEVGKQIVPTPGEFEAKWTNETSPEYIAAVTKYLNTNREVLDQLYRIGERPGSRFPVDYSAGFATLLPHLAQVKSLVQLLKLNTARQVRERNVEGACQSIESAFDAASTVRTEPLLISQLVGIACEAITLNALTNLLDSLPLNDEQLARLNTILAQHELDGRDGIFRGLVGERAIGMMAFNGTYNFQQLQGMSGGSGSGSMADWAQALGFQAYVASGVREHDYRSYLEMMEQFTESTRVDFPEALARSEAAGLELQRRFSTGLGRLAILSRMLLPSLEKALNKQAMISARLRCAEVSLAIERYRLAHHGELPPKLEDLAPDYLHKLPRSPFNGEPLAWQSLSKGYEVTSEAGPPPANRKNKGGAERAAFAVTR